MYSTEVGTRGVARMLGTRHVAPLPSGHSAGRSSLREALCCCFSRSPGAAGAARMGPAPRDAANPGP